MQRLQLFGQPGAFSDDVVDDGPMVVLVLNRRDSGDDGEPVEVVRILDRIQACDQVWSPSAKPIRIPASA